MNRSCFSCPRCQPRPRRPMVTARTGSLTGGRARDGLGLGRVQGVGMRWWIRARALELGLAGHAANLDDGRVEIVMEGPEAACAELLRLLRNSRAAPGGRGRSRP